jgi:hypothetical protein
MVMMRTWMMTIFTAQYEICLNLSRITISLVRLIFAVAHGDESVSAKLNIRHLPIHRHEATAKSRPINMVVMREKRMIHVSY